MRIMVMLINCKQLMNNERTVTRLMKCSHSTLDKFKKVECLLHTNRFDGLTHSPLDPRPKT